MMDFRLLQALRLKGRARPTDVASAIGAPEPQVTAALSDLVAAGQAEEVNGWLKLTPAGRAALAERLAAERADVDRAAITAAYAEFDRHNSAFKQLVTDWQLKDGVTPNDHTDAPYDAKLVERLGELHVGFLPLLERIVLLAPRLSHYPQRLSAALAAVRAGDHSWLARPLIDSYHTVWFELHQDVMGLAGVRRTDEAAAGRAE
jgi:DNA-binding MarR family transcriptional regulator